MKAALLAVAVAATAHAHGDEGKVMTASDGWAIMMADDGPVRYHDGRRRRAAKYLVTYHLLTHSLTYLP